MQRIVTESISRLPNLSLHAELRVDYRPTQLLRVFRVLNVELAEGVGEGNCDAGTYSPLSYRYPSIRTSQHAS